jgi:ribonuclease D
MPIRLAAVADLPELLAELQAAERLAVDTEFHAERHYLPHLFLVQVHVPGGTTWLLDPLVPDLLSAVAPVLSTRPWWVHGGSQDLRLLRRALGTVPEDVLDTQILAGLTDTWYPAPFAALLERWCQRALDKAATLSDWSRRPLSERQVHYAAADAEALAPLAAALQLRLADLGRTEIARLACLEAQARALGPVPDDAWREVPGAHQLVRNQPAVLQELLAWRDAIAMEEDQAPPRRARSGPGQPRCPAARAKAWGSRSWRLSRRSSGGASASLASWCFRAGCSSGSSCRAEKGSATRR